ncbi:MAG: HAD-IB family phosphatase [Pseudomonadota bacterium]
MTQKLLLLDMDGVIYQGSNFWLDLHRAMGTEDFALDLWDRMSVSDYVELSERTAACWKGRSAAPYLQMVADRQPTWGIKKLLQQAHSQGLYLVVVSSGSWRLAVRAKADYGIHEIHANRLGISNSGHFDGSVDVQVDDARKDVTVRRIQARLGISPESTMVIGDSRSDIPMVNLAAHSVGYRVKDHAIRGLFETHIDGRSIAQASSAVGSFSEMVPV